MALAFRLRAPVVAYLLAAMAAFSRQVAIHLVWDSCCQGAPTHFAVIGAGVLGGAVHHNGEVVVMDGSHSDRDLPLRRFRPPIVPSVRGNPVVLMGLK
jgi:hypothetical protein